VTQQNKSEDGLARQCKMLPKLRIFNSTSGIISNAIITSSRKSCQFTRKRSFKCPPIL